MTCATNSGRLRLSDGAAPVAYGVGARLKRLARRLTNALEAPRRAAVDRAIARLLMQSGGRLTDSLERAIDRKLFASDWRPTD